MAKKTTAAPAPEPGDRPGRNGNRIPPEYRFKPGQSGNPKGRPPNAGASIKEWINTLSDQKFEEGDLRLIALDKSLPWAKRTAAMRMLRTLEWPDLSDFAPYLSGEKTLEELRADGINTEAVKKAKVRTRTDAEGRTETEREIELHDRAGEDFDRVCDRTDGRPTQAVSVTGTVMPTAVVMQVVGPADPYASPDPKE